LTSNSFSTKKLIHHCCSGFSVGGGITSYIESLIRNGSQNVSDQVLTSLSGTDQSQYELLHVHEQSLLEELQGECPSIYTLHNHSSYCPSGTKYLKTHGICCERKMSSLACTWSHIVDGCGSRRPSNIVSNIRNSYKEIETLRKLKIPVITISDYSRRQLIKNGIPPEQTVTLKHGVPKPIIDSQALTREIHQNQRILFVGRIVPEKGLDWLLKALTKVDPKIHLDIAGKGWDRSRLENLSHYYGLKNRVAWHNWCSNEKLSELYQNSFALIFPSIWPEPAGLVTLEAYTHYRSVVASAVGGIPEYVRNGETGILVQPNNVQKLAHSITFLSQNYHQARQMGEQAYAYFLEKFTIEAHVNQLNKIYENSIERFKSHQ
jgi:glycosyltransferase involved in cell wall biosynthesis